jgi:hypothetical protein
MHSIKIAFGIVLAVCLLMVAATPSLAALPGWWDCRESKEGKFEDAKCSKIGLSKVFEWALDSNKTQSVKFQTAAVNGAGAALTLEDKEAFLGNPVKIECEVTGEGTVGESKNAAVDETKTLIAKKCKEITKICEGEPKVEAVNLPWITELEEPTKGEIRDKISSTKKHTEEGLFPGWKVTCQVFLTKEIDECTTETTSTAMKNENPNVLAAFDSKSAKAKCSLSKKVSGVVSGIIKDEPNEAGLGAIKVE